MTVDDLRIAHLIIRADTSAFSADMWRVRIGLLELAYANAYNRATCRIVTAL